MTKQELIAQVATDNGWVNITPDNMWAIEYRKGARYVYVAFNVRGAALGGSYGNGNKSKMLPTKATADKVIELLSTPRWTW